MGLQDPRGVWEEMEWRFISRLYFYLQLFTFIFILEENSLSTLQEDRALGHNL